MRTALLPGVTEMGTLSDGREIALLGPMVHEIEMFNRSYVVDDLVHSRTVARMIEINERLRRQDRLSRLHAHQDDLDRAIL